MTRCATCGAVIVSADCDRCGATSDDPLPGRGHGPIGLILTGLVLGGVTPFDGEWLEHYNPSVPGTDPNGEPMLVTLTTTAEPALALRFADHAAARREWMRWDGNDRQDGQPSRPLTAFTIDVRKLPS